MGQICEWPKTHILRNRPQNITSYYKYTVDTKIYPFVFYTYCETTASVCMIEGPMKMIYTNFQICGDRNNQ